MISSHSVLNFCKSFTTKLPKEGCSIFECWLVNKHLCAFCLYALHNSLNRTLTEIIAVRLHRQSVDAYHTFLFYRRIVVPLFVIIVISSLVQHFDRQWNLCVYGCFRRWLESGFQAHLNSLPTVASYLLASNSHHNRTMDCCRTSLCGGRGTHLVLYWLCLSLSLLRMCRVRWNSLHAKPSRCWQTISPLRLGQSHKKRWNILFYGTLFQEFGKLVCCFV